MKTSTLKSNLYEFNHTYKLVKGVIKIVGATKARKNTEIIIKVVYHSLIESVK